MTMHKNYKLKIKYKGLSTLKQQQNVGFGLKNARFLENNRENTTYWNLNTTKSVKKKIHSHKYLYQNKTKIY